MQPLDVPFRTGYRRNTARRALPKFSDSNRAETPYTSSVLLSRFTPAIFDQGQTGSCVGHSRARGIYTARIAAGRVLGFIPSPRDLYDLPRCVELQSISDELQDNGCDPVDSLDAARLFGVRPMGPLARDGRFSDVEVETVNVKPDLAGLERSDEFHTNEDHLISEVGPQRAQLVCAALAAGLPVCIDVEGGSDKFQTYSGGVLAASGGPLDHYVCLVGYSIDAAGKLLVYGHNSWGPDWGVRDPVLLTGGAFVADVSVLNAAQDVIVCVDQ